MSEEFSYDRILYPCHPFSSTHPDHLGMLAGLQGLEAAPATKCRVLELGCGNGGNLIPMALQLPGSEFVGIDLGARSIENGQAMIEQLGIRNLTLAHRNIMDISDDDGLFDYIIAHGVYSWVPQFVRDKVLSIYKNNLSPNGVAYVSYNALPGGHLRTLARSLMMFHVRGVTDPRQRTAQSRMLMQALADASREDQIYGFILRDQLGRIKDVPDEVFIHDDLDEGSTPFFLYQVVEAAGANGLQYVSEADLVDSNEYRQSKQARDFLDQIPESETVIREQYLDFITGRAFRKSLFCHLEANLQRPVPPHVIRRHFISSALMPEDEKADPAAPGAVVFKAPGGESLKTDHPLGKAALIVLGRIWPQAIAFPELLEQSLALVAADNGIHTDRDKAIEALTQILFQGFRSDLIQLHRTPPRLTTTISDKPLANMLPRWQAQHNQLMTNLMHSLVAVEDDIARTFIPLVDGTRTIDQLVDDLRAALASRPADPAAPAAEITRETVERNLRMMARLGLLQA